MYNIFIFNKEKYNKNLNYYYDIHILKPISDKWCQYTCM